MGVRGRNKRKETESIIGDYSAFIELVVDSNRILYADADLDIRNTSVRVTMEDPQTGKNRKPRLIGSLITLMART